MKIYLATQLYPDRWQGKVLTKIRYGQRLLSYFFLLENQDEVKKYIKTGRNDV